MPFERWVDDMGKVLARAALLQLGREIAAAGQRLVFTNGYFDLLHLGHVRYLQQAKALGDVLVVGVNADATAGRAKDPRRPIVPQDERAELVAALDCVDYSVIFEEETAEALVSALQPQVYVKGGDYGADARISLPEAPLVEAYGGQVVILPYIASHSTTSTIETIVQRYCPPPTRV